jgi:formiminoglutamase
MTETIFHYFYPVKDKSLTDVSIQDGYWGCKLFKQPSASELLNCDVVIIGVNETRTNTDSLYNSNADLVRYWLYQLSIIPQIKVVDLGNVMLGNSVNDTFAALTNIIEYLNKNNIVVVIIGGAHHLTLPGIDAIIKNKHEVGFAIIDSRFDVESSNDIGSQSFLKETLKIPKALYKGNIIGYQSYFITDAQFKLLEDNGYDLVRLGNLRSRINEVEPLLRDCDIVSFDLSAIKQSDCPASTNPGPNGLYTEESCQLANFSGLSDKMSVFGIYNLKAEEIKPGLSSHLAAQVIWHFLFGVSQRKGDYPACDIEKYKKIYVKIDRLDFDLIFYQNQQNNRYWVEIPTNQTKRKKIVACSENDYLLLCNNEIPDRIWRNIRNTMD